MELEVIDSRRDIARFTVVVIDQAEQRKLQRTHKSTRTRKSILNHLQGLESIIPTYGSAGHVRSMNIIVTLISHLPHPQLMEIERKIFPHCLLQASFEKGIEI